MNHKDHKEHKGFKGLNITQLVAFVLFVSFVIQFFRHIENYWLDLDYNRAARPTDRRENELIYLRHPLCMVKEE